VNRWESQRIDQVSDVVRQRAADESFGRPSASPVFLGSEGDATIVWSQPDSTPAKSVVVRRSGA